MRRKCRTEGFTLIELLAVIAIMVILVGLLLPTVMKAREQSRRVKARSDVDQIKTVWLAYLDEYRRFPSSTITNMGPTAVSILRGVVSSNNNPRGVVFMEFNVGATNYVDPWGFVYSFRLDSDYDNMISGLPGVTGAANVSVAVWSVGLDGIAGSSDDVLSWQK